MAVGKQGDVHASADVPPSYELEHIETSDEVAPEIIGMLGLKPVRTETLTCSQAGNSPTYRLDITRA